MGQPALSLCMIVKDEAENLGRCLDSVAGVVDEMVVVDTGSADGTPEVASAHGARVERRPWPGDFSLARNQALALARGLWILVLDADEELDRRDREMLRGLVAHAGTAGGPAGYLLRMINHLDPGERTAPETHACLRLFRNLPEHRYQGAVHEQPTVADPALAEVRIHHWGYLPEVFAGRQKAERNEGLLTAALQDQPGDPYLLYSLAVLHYAAGRYGEACEAMARALPKMAPSSHYRPRALKVLALAKGQAGDMAAGAAILDGAIAAYPDFTDLYYARSGFRRGLGDVRGAVADLCACLRLGDAPPRYDCHTGAGGRLAVEGLAGLAPGYTGAMAPVLEALLTGVNRAESAGDATLAEACYEAGLEIVRGEVARRGRAARPAGRLLAAYIRFAWAAAIRFLETGTREASWCETLRLLWRRHAVGDGSAGFGAPPIPTAPCRPIPDLTVTGELPGGIDPAGVYAAAGRRPAALSHYGEGLERSRGRGRDLAMAELGHLTDAVALTLLGAWSNALDELIDAERDGGASVDASFLKGEVLGLLGRDLEAAAAFERCLEFDEEARLAVLVPGAGSHRAACRLGEAQERLGCPRAALGSYARALAMEPACIPAYVGRARAWVALRPGAARERLEADLAPGGTTGPRTNLLLGHAWLCAGWPSWALPYLVRAAGEMEDLEDASEREAGRDKAQALLGLALFCLGRDDEAAERLAAAGRETLIAPLVLALGAAGRADTAEALVDQAASGVEAILLRGILETLGPFRPASDNAAHTVDPALAAAYRETPRSYAEAALGLASLAARRRHRGLIEASLGLMRPVEDPAARLLAAKLCHEAGFDDLAGPLLVESHERGACDAEGMVMLAGIRAGQGLRKQAEELLLRVTACDPAFWPAWAALWSLGLRRALAVAGEAGRLLPQDPEVARAVADVAAMTGLTEPDPAKL